MPSCSRESLVGGRNQHCGVGQRDEAGADRKEVGASHFSSSAAVTTEWAISMSFFWSFIAFERSAV